MRRNKTLSRLLCLFMLLSVIAAGGAPGAATLSLEPDSTFITTGVGSVFDLELHVDSDTEGFRLFQARIAFDTLMFDTVSTNLGPLFDTSGYTSVFNAFIYYDTSLATTILRLEGLLFGPTAVVDGPGVVAEVQLVVLGEGVHEFTIVEFLLTDINNDPIESDAEGSIVFIDYPPFEFDLISPIDENILGFVDSTIQFHWHPSSSIYDGDNIRYHFELSDEPSFTSGVLFSMDYLSDTTTWVSIASLPIEATYWWRVVAYGNTYGFGTESTPFGVSFFLSEPSKPSPFDLISPYSNKEVIGIPTQSIELVWNQSFSVYPEESILYDLDYGTSAVFDVGATVSLTGLTDSILSVNVDDLTDGKYYWRVLARGNVYGLERESLPFPDSFNLTIGADPGTFDLTSPADADLVDIVGLIEVGFNWQLAPSLIPDDTTNYYLFLSETYPFTEGEAFYTSSVTEAGSLTVPAEQIPLGIPVYWNVKAENRLGFTNWSESTFSNTFYMRGDMVINRSIDITDLVFLVTYMFSSGPAPQIMETADINCSHSGPDISDLVYLVTYMFSAGAPIGCN